MTNNLSVGQPRSFSQFLGFHHYYTTMRWTYKWHANVHNIKTNTNTQPCLDNVGHTKTQTKRHLIEICNDFIQQSQTFHPLVIAFQLHVKLGEVCDGGKHHAHIGAVIVVKLLTGNLQTNNRIL